MKVTSELKKSDILNSILMKELRESKNKIATLKREIEILKEENQKIKGSKLPTQQNKAKNSIFTVEEQKNFKYEMEEHLKKHINTVHESQKDYKSVSN